MQRGIALVHEAEVSVGREGLYCRLAAAQNMRRNQTVSPRKRHDTAFSDPEADAIAIGTRGRAVDDDSKSGVASGPEQTCDESSVIGEKQSQ